MLMSSCDNKEKQQKQKEEALKKEYIRNISNYVDLKSNHQRYNHPYTDDYLVPKGRCFSLQNSTDYTIDRVSMVFDVKYKLTVDINRGRGIYIPDANSKSYYDAIEIERNYLSPKSESFINYDEIEKEIEKRTGRYCSIQSIDSYKIRNIQCSALGI